MKIVRNEMESIFECGSVRCYPPNSETPHPEFVLEGVPGIANGTLSMIVERNTATVYYLNENGKTIERHRWINEGNNEVGVRQVSMRLKCENATKNTAPGDEPGATSNIQVGMRAVYSEDPKSPNYSYSVNTPHAELTTTITNSNVFDFFEEGEEYDVVITKRSN